MKETILIIDLYGLLFRAYYAITPMLIPTGVNINAVHGTLRMLFDICKTVEHDHVVLAMDGSGGNKRHEIFPEYKANRGECPEDLIPQFPILDECLLASGIKSIRHPGLEADDIINTLTRFALDNNMNAVVATLDKDIMQVVQDGICIYNPKKRTFIHEAQVIGEFCVKPNQIADYLALVGDPVDNIPGVPGIGPKKAASLLSIHTNLPDIYKSIDSIEDTKIKQTLIANKENAMLSLSLTQLIYDVEMPTQNILPSKLDFANIPENFITTCKKYNMNAILKYLKLDNFEPAATHEETSSQESLF